MGYWVYVYVCMFVWKLAYARYEYWFSILSTSWMTSCGYSWNCSYEDGFCDTVVLLEEGVVYSGMCHDLLNWAYCGHGV